ncbi:MAG: M20/M25/M40 family metallo-hydrolase [Bacteroidales bacterium]|nr:MAG: M20/M25/M40 family metallo-hydrolase [Bacteroidales bacterium]
MKQLLKIWVLVLVSSTVSCQNVQKTKIDINRKDLHQIIDFLASDSLRGRYPGTPYDKVSAKYIRDQFESFGLKPMAENGYQFMDIIIDQKPGSNNSLSINGIEQKYNTHFATLPFSSSGSLDASVVFVGFGFKINNERLLWNDYQTVDVTNKWVLILRGDPEPDSLQSVFVNQSSDRNKTIIAKDMGAKGVILVSGSTYDPNDKLSNMSERGYDIGIPVIQVKRDVANSILNGQAKVEELEKQLVTDRRSHSIELQTKAIATTDVVNESKITQNVIAKLEGSDINLKKEYIVIGAHFDHLGMGGKNTSSRKPDTIAVHNGADDNASGVAAMIELAQKLSAKNKKVKRSIVFIAFAAEEMGLIGSQKFVESNLVNNESVIAMINIDMLGRMNKKELQISGTKTSTESETILKGLNADSSLTLSFSPEGYGPSDHASFYNKSIPVFAFTTGVHLDYHTPFDDIDRINFDGMVLATNYIYNLTFELSNRPKKLLFQEAGPKSRPVRNGRGFKVKLGIIPDVSGTTNNGLKAIGVSENNPAYKAGMKSGDIITALNGKPVKNIQDYMFRLSELKAGMTVSVEIQRGEQKLVLLVQL